MNTDPPKRRGTSGACGDDVAGRNEEARGRWRGVQVRPVFRINALRMLMTGQAKK
jgi:hypothetical protein